jgi:alkylation response protein AidB-like acyl-CoA dehydrogenase
MGTPNVSPLRIFARFFRSVRTLGVRAHSVNGVPFERREGSMSKLVASEVAVKATAMGGWGYITDHPVEKWYRDAKLYTIFEGTSEIQRTVISTRWVPRTESRRCISSSSRRADR